MNVSVPQQTYSAVADATAQLQPEEIRDLARLTEEQRRRYLEAKGFDPGAIVANREDE